MDEIENMTNIYEENLPSYFPEAMSKLEEDIQNMDILNPERSKLLNLKNQLTRYLKMNIYGFNSSRFDLNVIVRHLVSIMKERELAANTIGVIKKGTAYFLLSNEEFQLKDALNFSVPCSLSKFLAMWGILEKKSIWPYSLFNSIEEIELTTEFPPIECFYNDLKGCGLSISQYNEARDEFNYRKMLPITNPDRMTNMKDWLIHYNCLDVGPLINALENCFSAFFSIFGKDVSMYNSLPSMALDTALGLYEKSAPLAWSFKPSFDKVRKLFKQNVIGGLGNLYLLDWYND